MKRSVFFIIIAVLNGFLGLFLMFGTAAASAQFGLEGNIHTMGLMRSLGTVLFSLGVLNFMIRNEADSKAMRAILVFNLLGHGLGIITAMVDVVNGSTEFSKVGPGLVVPLIGTIGSLIYLLKMKAVVSEPVVAEL